MILYANLRRSSLCFGVNGNCFLILFYFKSCLAKVRQIIRQEAVIPVLFFMIQLATSSSCVINWRVLLLILLLSRTDKASGRPVFFPVFRFLFLNILMNVFSEKRALPTVFLRLLSWPYNLMISEHFSSVIILNVFKLLHPYCAICKMYNDKAELICNISKTVTNGQSFDHLIFAFFIIICIISIVFAII